MLGRLDFEEEVETMNNNQRLRKEIFNTKKKFEDKSDKPKENKPSNFIPKRIWQLMKIKSKLSKNILSSSKWWTNLEMEEEIEKIEDRLYEENRQKKIKYQKIAIKKIKKDPVFCLFFKYRNHMKVGGSTM